MLGRHGLDTRRHRQGIGVNGPSDFPPNLYVHFPFCRRKCEYCALYSLPGSTPLQRAAHVARVVKSLPRPESSRFRTVYFGGGTPALCDLSPFRGMFGGVEEFTVELHPLDVTDAKLDELKSIGVNRISLGVQSFSDSTLVSMGRLHSSEQAVRAFQKIRAAGFSNSGLDLIVGWPGDSGAVDSVKRAIDLGAVHVSVYTLIVEPGTRLAERAAGALAQDMPSDDAMLDAVAAVRDVLGAAGINRYEISNYARPGFECRHNLAVWHGEDYLGLGPGAHSRVGRARWRVASGPEKAGECEWLRADEAELGLLEDARERALFALRLAEGIDLVRAEGLLDPSFGDSCGRLNPSGDWKAELESWRSRLAGMVDLGLVRRLSPTRYTLTNRGFEVCDAVSAELLTCSSQ